MPLFEFRCPFCTHTREKMFPSLEDARFAWVGCDNNACKYGARMERQVSAPSFRIHGFNATNGYSGRAE